MQPNTLTRRYNKVKIHVENIRKIHVGSGYVSETNLTVGSGSGSAKSFRIHNTALKTQRLLFECLLWRLNLGSCSKAQVWNTSAFFKENLHYCTVRTLGARPPTCFKDTEIVVEYLIFPWFIVRTSGERPPTWRGWRPRPRRRPGAGSRSRRPSSGGRRPWSFQTRRGWTFFRWIMLLIYR